MISSNSVYQERINPIKDFHTITYREHLIRYLLAKQFSNQSARVLDAGCGMGYGSFLLSSNSQRVIGIDKDVQAINFAKKNYKSSNLKFLNTDIDSLDFHSNSFNLISAFEFIEHLKNPNKFIYNASLWLSQDGLFISSMPNLKNKEVAEFDSRNPYHLQHLTLENYKSILKSYFPHVIAVGQNISRWYYLKKINRFLAGESSPITRTHDYKFSFWISRRSSSIIFFSSKQRYLLKILKKVIQKKWRKCQL